MPTPPPDETNLMLKQIFERVDDQTQKLSNLEHEIRGNGEKGLKQRVARIESHMYTNPHTGDPGVVRKVTDHEHLITGIRSQMRLLNWLLGTGVVGGIVWLLRVVFGPLG